MFVLILALLFTNVIVSYANDIYPYISNGYSNLNPPNKDIFSQSIIDYPINTGFETQKELNNLDIKTISEDAYRGKFAIELIGDDSIKCIKNSDYFSIGNSDSIITKSEIIYDYNNIKIIKHGHEIIICGKKFSDGNATLCVTDADGEIVYINEITPNGDNDLNFTFNLKEDGNYLLKMGNLDSENINVEFTLSNEKNAESNNPIILDTKINIIELWIKPKFLAENISFYTTGKIDGIEKQIKILGDKNNDGIFSVGEDFSQGKWQQVSLDLNKLSETPDNMMVKNLYVSLNINSYWGFDEITSRYVDVTHNEVDLSKFENKNIKYTKDGYIEFDTSTENEIFSYNNTPVNSTSNINLNEKIVGININSSTKRIYDNNNYTIDSNSLYEIPLSKDIYSNTISSGSSIQIPCNFINFDRCKIILKGYFLNSDSSINTISITMPDGYKINAYFYDEERSELNLIIPPILEKGNIIIKNEQSHDFKMEYFDIHNVVKKDVSSNIQYTHPNNEYVNFNASNGILLSDCFMNNPNYNNITNPAIYGSNSIESISFECDYLILRFINLNNTNSSAYVKGPNDSYYTIPYGESEIIIKKFGYSTCSVNISYGKDVLLLDYIKIDSDKNDSQIYLGENSFSKTIDGLSNEVISPDGIKVLYNNTCDNKYLYCYDTENGTNKKLLNISEPISACNYNGSKIVVDNVLYDFNKNINTEIDGDKFYFAHNDDLFVIKDNSIYKYKDKSLNHIINVETNDRFGIVFGESSDYFIYYNFRYYDNTHKFTLIKNSSNGCQYIDEYSIDKYNIFSEYIDKIFLSSDCNTLYFTESNSTYTTYTTYAIDLMKDYVDIIFYIFGCTSDGNLICSNYLYNPLTGERQYFNHTLPVSPIYNAHTKKFTYVEGKKIVIVDLNYSAEYDKYLLSFDGKKTWYSYKGGRWIVASTNILPTLEEIDSYGMNANEVNSIKQDDYNKIYANNTEVYTLNIALGMQSKNPYITPSIKNITIDTISNQPISNLYSSKIFSYKKNEYSDINGIYPIEDFPKTSECYYILYIGNDWLYTYKDDEILKIDVSADKLFDNISENWLKIKQYGMTASEIRNIPSDVLNELFLNKEFANNEFGIIDVIRINDNSTQNYKTEIKLSANANYLDENEYVLEIMLDGSNVLTFMPEEISKSQIDDFLSWINNRQNGLGDIFYRMKSKNSQKFINYYMITSVNVYTINEYENLNKI